MQHFAAFTSLFSSFKNNKKKFGLVLVLMKMTKFANPLAYVYPQRNQDSCLKSSWYLSSCFWHFR